MDEKNTTMVPPFTLTKLNENFLLTEEIKRSLKTSNNFIEPLKLQNPDTFIRASGYYRVCEREEIISSIFDISKQYDMNEENLQLILAIGDGMHFAMQNKILSEKNDTKLIGIWKCLNCGLYSGKSKNNYSNNPIENRIFNYKEKPFSCNCGGTEFLYVEDHFTNFEHKLSGHPDGFLLDKESNSVGILEIKSCSMKQALSTISRAPKKEHVLQVHIYMLMTGIQWSKIIYWAKGSTKYETTLYEFLIERDENIINEIKKTLATIVNGIETKTVPERTVCNNSTCQRALYCRVADVCFKIEDGKVPKNFNC